MISYGGVPLVMLDRERIERIQRNLLIEEIGEVADPEWTGTPSEGGTGSIGWRKPEFRSKRPVRLGKLLWPRGASRWATGHFLATEAQLDKIRRQAYTGDSRGTLPLDLVIRSAEAADDPYNLRVITASMHMLPPRPLFQFEADGRATIDQQTGITTPGEAGANLYLLTLVDDRYWWWYRSVQIDIANGDSWNTLYGNIATALGITISVDSIPSAYMAPPLDLQSRYDYLPLLLDAIAYSVGQRIVRKFDGTVVAMNADSAVKINNRNRSNFNGRLHLGGRFNFDPTVQRHRDLAPLVPDTVRLVVPVYDASLRGSDEDPADPCNTACRPDLQTYSNQLFTLRLTTEYGNVLPRRGQKTFRSTAIAWKAASSSSSSTSGNANIQNDTELQALARQLAIDWYKWQRGDEHAVFSGVCPWEVEGFSDFIEVTAFPAGGVKSSHTDAMVTYVSREQINDLATEVYHRSSVTSSSSSSGSSSSGSSSSGSSSSGSSSSESSSSESSSSESSSSDGCCHKTVVVGGSVSCVGSVITVDWTYDTIDYFCCAPIVRGS